jgi:hypothetical protein
VPRRTLTFPVEIIFTVLETGYYTHDRNQDTQLLLSASLVNRSWSPVTPFRHDVIRSQTAFTALHNCTMQNHPMGRAERILSDTRDHLAQRWTQNSLAVFGSSFSRSVSLFPNPTTLDLACYSRWTSTSTHQRDSKPFHILDDEEISILRTGLLILITVILAN